MDQRERIHDHEEVLRSAIAGAQAGIWTALPAIVQTVNTNGTIAAQPTIQARVLQSDGTYKWVNLPLLLDCPVIYIGGGNFVQTFPIQPGDEALIIFSSRCLDSWWQMGGIQKQAELRMHDLSDGFALIGPRSKPKAIANVSTATMQIRSLDGTQYIELAPGGVTNIVAPGGVNINGVQIDKNGNITTPGTVTASGEGSFNGGHTVSAHKHGGVQSGSAQTGTPTG